MQLRAASGPLVVDQIWQGMVEAGFRHNSRLPRQTLGARVAELARMRKIARVGPATYQLLAESSMEVAP
jgi:hypothetical protein